MYCTDGMTGCDRDVTVPPKHIDNICLVYGSGCIVDQPTIPEDHYPTLNESLKASVTECVTEEDEGDEWIAKFLGETRSD